MCGIAGIISLRNDGTLNKIYKSDLENMLMQIKDRGPDDVGIDIGDDFAIGNVRLKIVGNEQGRQPLQEGTYRLVFNGEIYNYKNLGKKNELKNIYSDTYLLFKLLQIKSVNILPELNGMFAFCYVTDNSIYLARDRFGKKPLFYTVKNNTFYFASEMKSFLSIIDFNISLSKTYMSLETEVAEKTIFDNIFQLEAGYYIKIDRNSKIITKKRYYSAIPQKYTNKSDKELIEEIRYLVNDAIKIRTDTDKPYAVYASGGIDSSIIALLSKPKYLFSFIPNSKLVSDEEQYVDVLAKRMKQTKLIKVSSIESDFLRHFIDMIYINEGPTTTFGAIAQYFLAREVKKHSIKIVLSGIGADEFFNGYVRHALATLPTHYFKSSLFKGYQALITKSKVADNYTSSSTIYSNLLNRSSGKNKSIDETLSRLFLSYKSPLTAISIADARFTLPPLLHTDDYLNMAFSVESRSPFMDYRLIEFGLGLTETHKIYRNRITGEVYTKYILREAFKDIIPKQIYQRKDKIGFTSNIADLLRDRMRYVFNISYEVLNRAFPKHPYLVIENDLLGNYSRWEYQICQLAITYLLFTKRYTREEVYDYYSVSSRNFFKK